MVVKRLGAKFRSKFLSISNLKRGLQLPGITCSALTFVHRRQVGVTRSARRLAFAMSNVFEWNWAKTFLAFTWFWKASPLPEHRYFLGNFYKWKEKFKTKTKSLYLQISSNFFGFEKWKWYLKVSLSPGHNHWRRSSHCWRILDSAAQDTPKSWSMTGGAKN